MSNTRPNPIKLLRTLEATWERMESGERYLENSILFEKTAETLCNMARLLPLLSGDISARQMVDDAICETQQMRAERTKEGWLYFRLPFLLPKKEGGNVRFVRTAVYTLCARSAFPKFEVPCVIAFCHRYNRNHPERRMRDHDNIELNAVVDLLALYYLKDDHPYLLQHYYFSAPTDGEDATEVYLFPVQDFPRFLQMKWRVIHAS